MNNPDATRADRIVNRAPRGGAVSTVNNQYYAGGQFMPMAPAGFNPTPAPLAGSSRMVPWATRLRREAIARLDDEIYVARLFLETPGLVRPAAVRARVRTLLVARHGLLVERSAAAILDRRASL